MGHDVLPVGTKFTISGVRFGKQFPIGFTTRCKPGNETTLVVKEHVGDEIHIKPAVIGVKKGPEPKRYGPKQRGRW